MHPRNARSPVATAFGIALLLIGLMTGGAAARASEILTIDIDLDTGVERFASDSPLLCPSGDAFTNFERGAGNFATAGTFHLTKLLVCDDDSGSFVIRVDAAANLLVGDGTTGGWSVLPGSGTGAYAGLKGGGNVVGIDSDTQPIDLTDHYFGSLRR